MLADIKIRISRFARFFILVCFPLILCQTAGASWDPGEIAFAEMNCVACHKAGAAVEARLASRPAPFLGPRGSQISPAWVRDFLVNPQEEKPGSLMPDVLHGLKPAEKAEAADALTHYLFFLQPAKSEPEVRFDPASVNAGRELYHRLGCVACHAPKELPAEPGFSGFNKTDLENLAALSEPLGDLEKKYSVEALAAFLRDPLKSRPGGRMPSQRLTEAEAKAISMYLLRSQPQAASTSRMAGLNVEFYSGLGRGVPDFGALKASSNGYSATFTIDPASLGNSSGARFRGVLKVAREGDYSFSTETRDNAQLFIDSNMVVDKSGGGRTANATGTMHLSAGEHSIVLTYWHRSGKSPLKVLWSGPGVRRQEIPGAALMMAENAQVMHRTDEKPFVADATRAARGKELFVQYNCAACHDVGVAGRAAAPFEKLSGSKKGCLAAKPGAAVPAFALSEKQQQDLRAWLSHKKNLNQPLSPADQVHRTMTALNCYACHSRDGEGGPAGLRRAFFRVNGNAELGEEGALPPHLNGVGAKLKPQWLAEVLFNGASVRPYMATRMPQFGAENVRQLAAVFEQADAAEKTAVEPVADPNFVDGLRLVGKDGLSCISCHVFAGHPSLGVPAMDLTTAPMRLNGDWFRRYLLDPAKLRPGTRMPSFWPGGVSANRTILGGDTEKQIGAIWSYLSSGKAAANLPPGLIPARMELVPTTEPLVYRNFIEGAGTRAIGVGYPEKVDLAFDANDMNVPLLWQGGFIDASRHRTGRGEGFEPPMGYDVLKFTPGAPFAMLADTNTAWPRAAGKAADFQFRGYSYDEQRHPQFRYRFGDIDIEDLFLPEKNPGHADYGFRRRLVLQNAKPVANVWFRAAVGNKIENLGNNSFLVDGNLHLAISIPANIGKNSDQPPLPQIVVRNSGGKFELLVPVVFDSGRAEIMEDIAW